MTEYIYIEVLATLEEVRYTVSNKSLHEGREGTLQSFGKSCRSWQKTQKCLSSMIRSQSRNITCSWISSVNQVIKATRTLVILVILMTAMPLSSDAATAAEKPEIQAAVLLHPAAQCLLSYLTNMPCCWPPIFAACPNLSSLFCPVLHKSYLQTKIEHAKQMNLQSISMTNSLKFWA